MSKQSRLSTFIAELRRRRVFRVAAFYGGIAFVIVQIIDGTFEVMGIPAWVSRLLITLLGLGFPVAMGLTWAFDITPEGIVRTEGRSTGKPGTSNRALIAVTIAAVAFGIWGRWGGGGSGALDSYEHTVAVMPFENLTNDPAFDVWERGLASLVISDLSGSEELYVLDSQSLFDVIQAVQQTRPAQLLPNLAREVANRTQVKQVILGDLLKTGTYIRVQARLLTVKTGKVDFSFKVDVENEDDLIAAAEEISRGMQNHLELNILRDDATVEGREGQTESAAAFKYYTEGLDYFWRMQFRQTIPLLEKAVSIDSNFAAAQTYLTYAYLNTGQVGQTKAAIARAKRLSGRISPIQQLITDFLDAWVNKKVNDQIRLLHEIVKAEPLSRAYWYVLGLTYGNMSQPEQAVRYYDKAYALCLQWESYWQWVPLYDYYGAVLHATGSHRKELAVYEYGLEAVPESPSILNRLGIHYLSTGDAQKAAHVLDRYREALVSSGSSEIQILYSLGKMYYAADLLAQAQAYYEQSIDADPENALAYNSLAGLLIDNDLDMGAGLAMAEKALDLRPGDYSILDTYGWGLFKLGRYAEAADALERSWALRPFYRQSAMDRLESARKALEEQG